MQLKYTKSISKSVITIELETTDFTVNEDTALKALGEPIVFFDKTYYNGFPVHIEKKIKTSFKIKVKFDGSESSAKFDTAVKAADDFFDDIKDTLIEEMSDLIDKFTDVDFKAETGTINISNY